MAMCATPRILGLGVSWARQMPARANNAIIRSDPVSFICYLSTTTSIRIYFTVRRARSGPGGLSDRLAPVLPHIRQNLILSIACMRLGTIIRAVINPNGRVRRVVGGVSELGQRYAGCIAGKKHVAEINRRPALIGANVGKVPTTNNLPQRLIRPRQELAPLAE